MNDNEIKKILEKDKVIPKPPKNEWSNILNKIDERKQSFLGNLFSFQALSATLGALVLVTISLSYLNNNSSLTLNEKNAIEFLMEDSYLSQNQDSYSWVDSF